MYQLGETLTLASRGLGVGRRSLFGEDFCLRWYDNVLIGRGRGVPFWQIWLKAGGLLTQIKHLKL